MPYYNDKEVTVVFTVDYSANSHHCTIYEIQKLHSNHFDTNDRDLLQRLEEQQMLWFEYFRESTKNQFVIELPAILNGRKTEQRKLLTSNPSTASLCPSHLFCTQQTDLTDILSFIEKHDNKVVLKANGSLGNGNIFLRDITPGEKTKKIIENFMRTKENFVAEAEIMHTPDDAEKHVGVYYRAIVFYNTEQDSLDFFDVYKITLDTRLSTNSHLNIPSVVLSEELYLLTHSVAELRNKMISNRSKNSGLNSIKKNAFKNISKLLANYIFSNRGTLVSTINDRSLCWFVKYFHADNLDAYKNFFYESGENQQNSKWDQNHLFFKTRTRLNQDLFCGFKPGFLISNRF